MKKINRSQKSQKTVKIRNYALDFFRGVQIPRLIPDIFQNLGFFYLAKNEKSRYHKFSGTDGLNKEIPIIEIWQKSNDAACRTLIVSNDMRLCIIMNDIYGG